MSVNKKCIVNSVRVDDIVQPNDTLQEELSLLTGSQNPFFFKVQSEFSVQVTIKKISHKQPLQNYQSEASALPAEWMNNIFLIDQHHKTFLSRNHWSQVGFNSRYALHCHLNVRFSIRVYP